MSSSRALGIAALLAASTSGLAHPVAGQLGARPADQWAVTLESGRRLESLDIDNVVAAVGLEPGDVVADIGAGTGIFSVPMAKAVGPDGLVISVEVDPGFLPIIRKKANEQGVANISTILGEFGDPRLPRRDIDVAFFHDVLHHIENRGAYMQALAKYMAPGSRIVVVDYDKDKPGNPHANQPEMLIGPDDVRGWVAAAGFEPTREVNMFPEKFFVIYTKVR